MDHVLLCVLDFLILSFLCCGNSQVATKSVLTVSPSWLSPGASVTLSCEVKPSSAGWRFYWYKVVPDLSQNNYRYELLPGNISGTVENSSIITGQKHTAGFACRAGRGSPEIFTDYSGPKFIWSADPHPAASLSVSPDREQHFTSESVTLNCGGNSTEWRVKEFIKNYDKWREMGFEDYSYGLSFWDEDDEMTSEHQLSDCSNSWKMTGSSCTINIQWSHKAVYWCESVSGEFSNAVNISINEAPDSVLTVSPSWPSPGASVTLSCEVKPSSAGWRFYWYKVVPDLSQNNYRYELLPGSFNGTVENSFIITGQKHTAGFACRAGRGNPEYLTDSSKPTFVWTTDPHPAASLSVSPDREQHFTSESVTLNCGGNSTEWRVKQFRENSYGLIGFWDEDDEMTSEHQMSDCSNLWEMTGSPCTINIHRSHKAVYWCESVSGEFSNAVNISINVAPDSVLTVSPSWPSPGASVTLSCEVKPSSAGWRFYWYKAVPDLSQKNYRYELLPGNISGTVENSFIITGQKHTAGFACRAGRGNPEYLTDYSEPKFIWSADPHPAASLSVSPDREQHFTSESVTLNCGGNSTEWRVMGFTEITKVLFVSHCSNWGKMTGSSCTINSRWFHKSVYWCESGSGEFSNAVNISINDEGLLLVSPVHPVTEGASVTLSCRLRGENQLSNVFFYHNDKLIQSDSRGELNISAVSQSDEGFYKCEHSGKVSPQSWMAVKAASRPGSSSFPVLLLVGSVIGIIVLILLLLICYVQKPKCCGSEQPVGQDEHLHQVYSSLLHGDLCVYETLRDLENSGNGQLDESEKISDKVDATSE
ncbi:obscurin-like isoform X1 [Xiphophorus hellerii]|uniref:obscurin-like isoform X1 n=1 Tax=Xiphophorus hellerii TaxID=8084 RepID=UPI0013B43CDC|nr:obscurin-like isoform X1 [Xiphophorus hellerii]